MLGGLDLASEGISADTLLVLTAFQRVLVQPQLALCLPWNLAAANRQKDGFDLERRTFRNCTSGHRIVRSERKDKTTVVYAEPLSWHLRCIPWATFSQSSQSGFVLGPERTMLRQCDEIRCVCFTAARDHSTQYYLRQTFTSPSRKAVQRGDKCQRLVSLSIDLIYT